MHRRWLNTVTDYLRRTHAHAAEPCGDAELLQRYLVERDETAFELLVWRHASMVLGVCRRMLGDADDADDAFQATFLIFVRKAGSIGRGESVASWLYQVAFRTASRLRAQLRRQRNQRLPLEIPARYDDPAVEQCEIAPIIDEEMQRLPEKYRVTILLHVLQGHTCRDIAQQLGWPLGTVATRLKHARRILQQRLTRRGVTLSAGMALGVPATAVTAGAEMTALATRAALSYAAGTTGPASVAAPRVILLAEGVLHAMKLRMCTAALVWAAFILLGGGAAWALWPEASVERPAPVVAVAEPADDDWRQFGGTPARNMVNRTAKNLPTAANLKSGMGIKWRSPAGTQAMGGPVVAGGRIFVGTNNTAAGAADKGDHRGVPLLLCLDEPTGKLQWQATHARLPQQIHDAGGQGISSTPTIDGERAYYMSNRCTLVCARAAGKAGKADIVWEYDLIKELGVFPQEKSPGSPLVAGDLVFAVTGNGVDDSREKLPAPAAPSFIAVHKQTGKLVWQDNSPGKAILHAQWSSPAYAEIAGKPQVLFPGGDGWLRAFEPASGKLIWKFDCNPANSRRGPAGASERSHFLAVPVVHEGRIYIGVGQDPKCAGNGAGHLWCIDPAQPKALPPDGDISPTLITDAATDPPTIGPNPRSGAVWHYGGPNRQPKADRKYEFGRTLSTCAVHDGLVYAADLDGYLHCLDARTGRPLWVQDVRSSVWGSPLWADGKVYLGTDDGDLWVLKHGPAKAVLGKVEFDGPIRSTPVAANGVLYVMTDATLFALVAK